MVSSASSWSCPSTVMMAVDSALRRRGATHCGRCCRWSRCAASAGVRDTFSRMPEGVALGNDRIVRHRDLDLVEHGACLHLLVHALCPELGRERIIAADVRMIAKALVEAAKQTHRDLGLAGFGRGVRRRVASSALSRAKLESASWHSRATSMARRSWSRRREDRDIVLAMSRSVPTLPRFAEASAGIHRAAAAFPGAGAVRRATARRHLAYRPGLPRARAPRRGSCAPGRYTELRRPIANCK